MLINSLEIIFNVLLTVQISITLVNDQLLLLLSGQLHVTGLSDDFSSDEET